MRKIPIYTHPAAGWPALIASTRKLMDYKAFLRGSISVLGSNQPKGGFDCPGCAWPDHNSHKSLDVCETGIKVIASEAMSTRADAQFFAKHTVTELQGWSGYELEHIGRLSEPLYYDAVQDHYMTTGMRGGRRPISSTGKVSAPLWVWLPSANAKPTDTA